MENDADLTRFLDYLKQLACEGETPLILRQRPRMGDDGRPKLHPNGMIQSTYPAFLPDASRIKPDQAWYGNTAAFILDRFKDGKISAARANCEYCLVLMLDDVGTKSKVPPLAPTWIMESSPGNFQYGYAFSEDQPTANEFSAAVLAIADAGYTDPGACNPVRNFRLPGSVNLKPQHNGFRARLVEFHPERQFTLPEICAAFGVTPGQADGATYRPISISDPGGDDVFGWLVERGLVLSKPNQEGWAGVVCPNHAEHTDGSVEGRYKPLTRAYCCLHSHCIDFNTKTFLEWVAEQGGPKHEGGLREEVLVTAMQSALNRLEPSQFFNDDAKQVIEEVERKEAGRLEKKDWWNRYAYIEAEDAYFDMERRVELTRTAFNALFRHIPCQSIHNQRRIEASICYDENRAAMNAKVLRTITYAPGETVLCARDGEVYGNRWRDARPQPGSGDVTPWLAHCEALLPERSEREHILNVMAFKVQNPRVKVNHAVLHGGTQGCGKDTMWAPFFWAVCGPHRRNFGKMDNDTLNSTWGYQYECEILLLNELKEPEATQRRLLANKLKPVIAAPPDTLTVNRKNMHPYEAANRLLVVAFTNEQVPITLDSQDRRWFAVWSHAPLMTPAAGQALWGWYAQGGMAAVAGWLHARDVSAFNPAAAPVWTEYKTNLVEHGMSMAESYLVDLIRGRHGEFARGVVGGPFHALCDRLIGAAPSGVKIPQAALLHALKEAGWTDMGRLASGELQTKKHIFASPDMASRYSKSDLRRMCEPEASATLKVVK